MSWDVRDTRPATPPADQDTPPVAEPASPALVPTLAVLAGLDEWLDDPLTLDNLSPQEQEDARVSGLVPPGQWSALRRLMFRGVTETK